MKDDTIDDKLPVECRFVVDGAPASRVFRDALLADHRAARLSPAFRAYYSLRSMIPLGVRQFLQRHRTIEAAPGWYLPQSFVDILAREIEAAGSVTAIHPWPDRAAFAFVPTHDVETVEGMRRIPEIAALEEDLGFRSSWNIVPHKYRVDMGLIRDLQRRGFEIGIHGYNHDGKLFTSRAIFDRRAPCINRAAEAFQATGFRAPMVHRNLDWLQSLGIEYDASYFDIDPFQAMPGGVGGVWPFVAGRFIELPYTLPQDHTLFITLGERDGRIWEEKLDFVASLAGMAMLITHPDYLDSPDRIAAYRQLLNKAREFPGMWHALPREVAAWWRMRDKSKLVSDPVGGVRIDGPARVRGRAAQLAIDANGRLAWVNLEPCSQVEPEAVGITK